MYIGVDGGGTKTAFALINEDGLVLAKHHEATCHYLAVGIDGMAEILSQGITSLLNDADAKLADVKYSFFGLPSYGEDQAMLKTLEQLPREILGDSPYSVGNDSICGWAGSLACQDGINIVAGTGSISYGEFDGAKARCGGWGELFGDEGSAFWIASAGLNVFTKMSDGRIKKGPLYSKLRKHLNLDHDLDLPGIILDQWQGKRHLIAGLSRVVCEACHEGDSHAAQIFNQAGHELAQIVDATRSELNIVSQEKVKLSYSGGVFNAGDLILKPMQASLKSDYILCKPRLSPVIGAALYAAKLNNMIFDESALSRLS